MEIIEKSVLVGMFHPTQRDDEELLGIEILYSQQNMLKFKEKYGGYVT
jgi:hypothetical protein